MKKIKSHRFAGALCAILVLASALSPAAALAVATPSITYPARDNFVYNNDTTPDFTFTFNVNYYHVQVASDGAFRSVVCEETRWPNPTYTPTLSHGIYYIRVRANSGGQWSDWSEPRCFSTGQAIPEARLGLSHSSVSFSADGGSVTVTLSNTGKKTLEWNFKDIPWWMGASPTWGKVWGGDNMTATVTASQNTGASARSGTVEIVDRSTLEVLGTIRVDQAGAQISEPADLYLSTSSVSVDADGGTVSVRIYNWGDLPLIYQIQESLSWAGASPSQGTVSGNGSATATISAVANNGTSSRSGTVTFVNSEDSGDRATVTVRQDGRQLTGSDLELSVSSLSMDGNGGTRTFEIANEGETAAGYVFSGVPDWVIIAPFTGSVPAKDSLTASVTLEANESLSGRQCTLTLKNNQDASDTETLVLVQSGREADPGLLNLAMTTVPGTVPAEGGTYQAVAENLGETPLDYSVKTDRPEVVSVSPSSGRLDGGDSVTLALTVAPNNEAASREATVTFQNLTTPANKETIGVFQQGLALDLNGFFEEAGARYDIPPNLLRAIAWVESRFNQAAVSTTDDYSIMGLNEDGLSAVAGRLKQDFPDLYGDLSVQEIIALIKGNTLKGARAAILGAAGKLDALVEDLELIYDDEPRGALEVWHFALAAYNGGGADCGAEQDGVPCLWSSNYPFRVWDAFYKGVYDPVTGIRIPQVPITLPPWFFFRKAISGELTNGEVTDADAALIPSGPKGFIRVVLPYHAVWDMRVLHDNEGDELTLSEEPEEDELVLVFPLEDYHAYNAPLNSCFDLTSPNYSTGDGVVMDFIGETGYLTYGSDPAFPRGYRQASREPFVVNGNYTGGGDVNHLYYNGHPGVDYRALAGTEIRAMLAGTFHVVANPAADNKVLSMAYVENGRFRVYILHARKWLVADGTEVEADDEVAEVGDKGSPGSPHLHIEVKVKAGGLWWPVDPYGWQKTEAEDYTLAGNAELWSGRAVGGEASGVARFLRAEAGDAAIALHWEQPLDVVATAFNVFRNGSFLGSVPSADTDYVDEGVTAGRKYAYEVRAVVADVEAQASNTAWAMVWTGDQKKVVTYDTNENGLWEKEEVLDALETYLISGALSRDATMGIVTAYLLEMSCLDTVDLLAMD